jgi:hypothetical protein
MDFGLTHLEISNLAASTMAELSCNTSTDKIKEFLLNSDSEEQYLECIWHRMWNIVMILLQQRKHRTVEKEKMDTVIQFNVSDSTLNHGAYLISYVMLN